MLEREKIQRQLEWFLLRRVPVFALAYLFLYNLLIFSATEYPYDNDIWKFLMEAKMIVDEKTLPIHDFHGVENWYPPVFAYSIAIIYGITPLDIYSSFILFVSILMIFQCFAVFWLLRTLFERFFTLENRQSSEKKWLAQLSCLIYFLSTSNGVTLGPLFPLPLVLALSLFYVILNELLKEREKANIKRRFRTILFHSLLFGLFFSTHLFAFAFGIIFVFLLGALLKQNSRENHLSNVKGTSNRKEIFSFLNFDFALSVLVGSQIALVVWLIPYNLQHGKLPVVPYLRFESLIQGILFVEILVILTLFWVCSPRFIPEGTFKHYIGLNLVLFAILILFQNWIIEQSQPGENILVFKKLMFWSVFSDAIGLHVLEVQISFGNPWVTSILRWLYLLNPLAVWLIVWNIFFNRSYHPMKRLQNVMMVFFVISMLVIGGSRVLVFSFFLFAFFISVAMISFSKWATNKINKRFCKIKRYSEREEVAFTCFLTLILLTTQTFVNFYQTPFLPTRQFPSEDLLSISDYLFEHPEIRNILTSNKEDFFFLKAQGSQVVFASWHTSTLEEWQNLGVQFFLLSELSNQSWLYTLEKANTTLVSTFGDIQLFKIHY